MGAPSILRFRGSVTATGANIDVNKCGFRPRKVTVRRGGNEGHWQEGMADASVYKRTAAGVGSLAAVAGITPLATGFRIGTDADLNPGGGGRIDFEATSE